MAFPTTVRRAPTRQPGRYGIVLGLRASDTRYQLALERAPDSGGSPDTGNVVRIAANLPGSTLRFVDLLPRDGAYRHYRLLHVGPGVADSTPTAWVKAKPVLLDDTDDPFPRDLDGGLRGALGLATDGDLAGNIDGDTDVQGGTVFVEDTETVAYGSGATPVRKTKTIRLHAAEFVPTTHVMTYSMGTGTLRPGTSGVALTVQAPVVLPVGARVTALRARMHKGHLTASFSWSLFSQSDTGVTAGEALGGSPSGTGSTGYQTSSDTADVTVGAAAYLFEVSMNDQGTGTGNVGLLWVEIDYDVPDYSTSI